MYFYLSGDTFWRQQSSTQSLKNMAKNNFISLGTDPLRVEFSGGYSIEDKGLYDFFKRFPAGEYDQQFQKALRLGVYALEEERIAAFLGRAENELDAGLERLKIIYKMVHLKEKSAGKGAVAEVELADVLQQYIDSMNWGDGVSATGEKTGLIPRRKVGDLVVAINNTGVKVVIESKMDASVPVGDPVDLDERSKKSGNPEKSAYGQNLTALVNREAQVAISVFDKASTSTSIRNLADIVFQPELPGFIVKIDRARGDFANVCLAYSLARAMALMGVEKINGAHLNLVLKRMVRDLDVLAGTEVELEQISDAANATLKSVENIRNAVKLTQESLSQTQELLNGVLAGTVELNRFRLFFNERKDK